MLINLKARLVASRDGDGGSVMIAMIAVMVVTFALVATMGAVFGALTGARRDQNRTNAFQFANAGIDQALYRIDSRTRPPVASGTYVPTVVSGLVVGFTETVTVGTSTFAIQATQDPLGQDTVWKVRSTGTDPSGRQRQAIATVAADSIFENGFFTHRTFYLTGNQDAPLAYNSATCPTAATSCDLPLPIPARLGTNDIVDGSSATFDAFKLHWEGFNMYGRATQASADDACGGGRCGTAPKVAPITNRLETPYPAEPVNSDGCPSGGIIGFSGATTTIQPGNYVCNSLELRGTIVVGSGGNGSGIAKFWVRGAFTVQAGGIVNQFQSPRKFQVYQKDTPGGGTVCDARIWGLLLTPGLEVDCHGSHQPEFWGAVVAELHSGTGNHLAFHYDVNSHLDANYGRYHVQDWRECPVGATDC